MLVSEHPEIQSVVNDLRTRFAEHEDAATNPQILAVAYSELAEVCREVGKVDEAQRYEANAKMLKDRKQD